MATPVERQAARKLLADDEQERLSIFNKMEEELVLAGAKGEEFITLKLPVKSWLMWVGEVKDRHPRNLSMLLHNDFLDNANELLDRLHEEVSYMIYMGPSETVAERYHPMRQASPRKIAVSDELRKQIQKTSLKWTCETCGNVNDGATAVCVNCKHIDAN